MAIRALSVISLSFLLLVGCLSAFGLRSSDIEVIIIYELDDFERVSEEAYKSFENASELTLFVNAVNSAEEYEGEVDMPPPDFEAMVVFENVEERSFQLWIDENSIQGAVKEIGEDEYYGIPESFTQDLQELLLNDL